MDKLFRILLIIISTFTFTYASGDAPKRSELLVGTKIAPPFAMKNDDGEWEGISIELWKRIALSLEMKFKFQEHNLKTLLEGVESKSLDVAIAAITITGDRERKFDFTHSYYTTGLGIAVPDTDTSGWMSVIKGIFSRQMLLMLLVLGLLWIAIGATVWLVERKKNPQHFDSNPIKGIFSGAWWAAVTMTTVGYGDMAPKTLAGRLIALLWMLASLLIVSSVIAGVASSLTIARLDRFISSPADLSKGKIASIKSSVSDNYLKKRGIHPVYFGSVVEGLRALKENKVDAMVYDAPLLQYNINKSFSSDLMMLDYLFESQNYGIALPENSPLREKINRAILDITHSQKWKTILDTYLGTQG